jgi:peptidoglycan/xylan/chitin deacetylase (PgdA/CDA1 family)
MKIDLFWTYASIVLSGILFLPVICGAAAILIFGRRKSGRIPALLMHSVPSKPISGISHISPDKFEKLASHIKSSKRITLTVTQAGMKDFRISDAESSVIMTFDDAFTDFYENAFPILKKHQLNATVFAISGFVAKSSSWDIYSSLTHMDARQLREIASAGIEVGSHTATHPDLLMLSDRDVKLELDSSKKNLEDIIGAPVTSLSFPFGRWNTRIWEHAKKCGYLYAAAYGTKTVKVPGIIGVEALYSFDSIKDIIEKISGDTRPCNSRARSRILPHYAKGTPLWRFRKSYRFG